PLADAPAQPDVGQEEAETPENDGVHEGIGQDPGDQEPLQGVQEGADQRDADLDPHEDGDSAGIGVAGPHETAPVLQATLGVPPAEQPGQTQGDPLPGGAEILLPAQDRVGARIAPDRPQPLLADGGDALEHDVSDEERDSGHEAEADHHERHRIHGSPYTLMSEIRQMMKKPMISETSPRASIIGAMGELRKFVK